MGVPDRILWAFADLIHHTPLKRVGCALRPLLNPRFSGVNAAGRDAYKPF